MDKQEIDRQLDALDSADDGAAKEMVEKKSKQLKLAIAAGVLLSLSGCAASSAISNRVVPAARLRQLGQ